MSDYKIGLEVHVQLVSLKTKLFCSCPTDYRGKPPNTNICPTCTGLPGALPVLNTRAVEEGLKIALTLQAKPNMNSYFFRKSYFYPDLPKNFQITQYDKAGGIPLALDGQFEIKGGKVIRIERIHMEEDPGRIYYEGGRGESRYSLVDYNRSGIALVEIVTSPDFSEPYEARGFLELLQGNLEELGIGISEHEGSMRCDANISYKGGERVEVKNISGAAEVEKALRYETIRQRNAVARGMIVKRETRSWDERRRITIPSRSKEMEAEYKYMPEPDLPPVVIDQALIDRMSKALQASHAERYKNLIKRYRLGEETARRLAADRLLSDLFLSLVENDGKDAEKIGNIMANEFAYLIKKVNPVRTPTGIPVLREIMDEYIKNGDKSRFRNQVSSWLQGEPIKPEEAKEAIDLDVLINSVVRKEEKNMANLDVRKRLDYLMGQIVKAEPLVNRKELFRRLEKRLGA